MQINDLVETVGNSSELFIIKSSDKKNDASRLGMNSRRAQNEYLMMPENIAFKCTYKDGGRNQKCISFIKVCSDSLIHQHTHDGHRWCSTLGCPCYQYENGMLTRKELDTPRDRRMFIYYECCMIDEWKAHSGTIRNGLKEEDKSRLRIPSKATLPY